MTSVCLSTIIPSSAKLSFLQLVDDFSFLIIYEYFKRYVIFQTPPSGHKASDNGVGRRMPGGSSSGGMGPSLGG